MKPLPSNPLAMQARIIGALCDDLFDVGSGRARNFPRVNAIREIRRQERGQ